MAIEAKGVAVSVAHPAVVPLTHSATWQTEMNAAFAVFLQNVNTQLVQTGRVLPRPVMLTYAHLLHEETFIECTLIAQDLAHPDPAKMKKLLTVVQSNGAIVFERCSNDWRMHYRQGKDHLASMLLNDPVQIAQLKEMAQSGNLADGFAVYDLEDLQTILQLAGSLSRDAVQEAKKVSLSKIADQLTGYLTAAGLEVIPNPIDFHAPEAHMAALKNQLAQHPETQVLLLATPTYMTLANQRGKLLHNILVGFGAGKKDSLLMLTCLGGFAVSSKIVPGSFLFRDVKALLRPFDGPEGGMPAFLDLLGDLSGKSGLGLLPDLLDIESTHRDQQATYAALFTALSQTQARLTTDHALEENLDAQLMAHPLRGHYDLAQGLQVEAEEKYNDVSARLTDFLSDSRAKTALLLSPTLADTALSGLAVVNILRQQASHPRVIAIDLAQYPGRAAYQCVALTLRHTLKLAAPIIQQLRQHTLGEAEARPTVLVFKNYQHTGSYDNLYIKNMLADWLDIKVVVTCTGDYFNRHDPKVCFLSDPTSPDASSLQQITLAGFATQAAQAATRRLVPTKLENLESLLAGSGLTPKRQAQQVELDRFLEQIAPLANTFPADARNAFISYAWEPNKNDLARQQRHLRQIVQDLGRVGFPTWLDIERMTGDINAQMAQNIQSSRYVLLIGTPRYTQRATVLLNGQPTNVKREYDDILQGHQAGKLEVLALSLLPKGPFDGEKSAHYPSFPETLPASLPRFDVSGVDDFDIYIRRLTDEENGLLPQLLHLTERSPEDQTVYRTAKAALTDALDLLPAQHLIIAQAEQDQRIYEVPQRRSLYIEARGKAELKNDSPEFGLTARFDAFLSTREDVEESKDDADPDVSPSQATTFVALGEGGSGKSLFSQIQYARLLEAWQAHKANPATNPRPAWIPIYIPLKQYVGKHEESLENRMADRVGEARVNTCVETALREVYHLDDRDIGLLKAGSWQGLGVLLILDGFDELGGETPHLYHLNDLGQDWACPLKLLITSRVDYIPDPRQHKHYFATRECSFVRGYIQPFSAEDIQRYIQLYETQLLIQYSQVQAARDIAAGVLPPTTLQPRADTYQTLAALPGLLELVRNPFLLNLVLQGLPYLLAERHAQDHRPVTRLAIYDSFSQYWFGKEVYRLVNQDNSELRLKFEQHAEQLAFQLYLYQQLSVSQKRAEDEVLWDEFFDASTPDIAKARAALPLRDAGDQQYEFMHKTLFEYFVTRHLVNAYHRPVPGQSHPNPVALGEVLAARPPEHKVTRVAGVPLPVQDAGVFSFLSDVIVANEGEGSFKTALFGQITRSQSKRSEPLGLAAAHAVTILTKTGISMANQAWSGAQLPGADLGSAFLLNTNLSNANLQGACLAGTFLYGADLSHANLSDVRFMGYPRIDLKEKVRCLALNQGLIVVAQPTQDGRVTVVNSETGHIVAEVHEGGSCVAFSPSPDAEISIIASARFDVVMVWNINHWSHDQVFSHSLFHQLNLRGHGGAVTSCVFGPSVDYEISMVSGSVDKTLLLWRYDMKHVILQNSLNSNGLGDYSGAHELPSSAVLRGHGDAVTSCAFIPTGDRVVSGSEDTTLMIWQISKESKGDIAPYAVLRGHELAVTACAFSPSGGQVVSASQDHTLRFWNLGKKVSEEFVPQTMWSGHRREIMACIFNSTGDQVISVSRDEARMVWGIGKDIGRELIPQVLVHGRKGVRAFAFSLVDDLLVSGDDEECSAELKIWKMTESVSERPIPRAVLPGYAHQDTICVFSPAGDQLVSGNDDGTLTIWKISEGMMGELVPQAVLRGHEWRITACAFSSAGDRIVSGSRDRTLMIWQVKEGVSGDLTPRLVMRGHKAWVSTCAFSPVGDLVVSGSSDGTLMIWKVKEGISRELSPQVVLEGRHQESITACVFSPTGDLLISAGEDKRLCVWDIKNIKHVHCMQIVPWCADVLSLDIYPKNYQRKAVAPNQAGSALPRLPTKAKNSTLVRIVVGDGAGLVSLWLLKDKQLHFSGMPAQPGVARANWRDAWKGVKLAGAQVTEPMLLSQYRNQRLGRIIADEADKNVPLCLSPQNERTAESKHASADTRAPQGKTGFFSRFTHRSTQSKAKVLAPPSGVTTGGLFARFLPHRGPADQGIEQAQQHLGQAVLALLAAIETQRQPDWHPQAHIDFTAAVVSAFFKSENGEGFAKLCPPPRRIPMPASLCQFIETYISAHPELRELNADIDFARHLKSKLLFKLDELYERFSVPDPAHAGATLDGGNAFV